MAVNKAQSSIVRKNSTGSDYQRRRVNFIEGSGVTLTMSDDSTNNEVDLTIAASGSSLYYNVTDYGAVGDGSTDDSTAINNAIGAASTAGGGTVVFPNDKIYQVTSTINLKTSVNLLGLGSNSHIRQSGTGVDLFTVTGTYWFFSTIRNLKLEAQDGAGHILNTSSGGVYDCGIYNCEILQDSAGKCLIYSPAGNYVVCFTFEDNYTWSNGSSRSISPMYFVKDDITVAMNANFFRGNIYDQGSGAVNTGYPWVHLESTDTSDHAIFNNVFRDETFQYSEGGYFKILSTSNTVIENCWGWDQQNWQSGKHLVVVDKSSTVGAENNVGLRIINSGRNGSAGVPAGTAQKDIYLSANVSQTTIENFRTYPDNGIIDNNLATESYIHCSPGTTVSNLASDSVLMQDGDITVKDEAYGVGWNGSLEVPTKNAIYDKIETITTTPTVITQTGATLNETATTGVKVILCDCTSNAITVNLPTAVSNQAIFHIKKIDSSTNAVTIDPSTTETVDGSSTAVISVQNTTLTLVSNNSNWFII